MENNPIGLTHLEKELNKFSITDAIISELNKKYSWLKINGIDDKEGYKAVSIARKHIKMLRVDVEKTRKEINADAVIFQRKVNEEAKRVTALLEPLENLLEYQEKAYEDEIAKIKREKEEAEGRKYQSRCQALNELEFKFDGFMFKADYAVFGFSVHELKELDDGSFDSYISEFKTMRFIHLDKLAAIAKRETDAKAQADAIRKKEQEALELQRQEQVKIALEQAERARVIEEKELALRLEAERLIKKEYLSENKLAELDLEQELYKAIDAEHLAINSILAKCKIDGSETIVPASDFAHTPFPPLFRMVSISESEYIELKNGYNLLHCLYAAGVLNWEGYEFALEKHEPLYVAAQG